MKDKLGWIAIGILTVGIVLAGFLGVAVRLRDQKLAQQQPFAQKQFDQLAKAMWPVEDRRKPPAERTSEATAVAGAATPGPLPDRLEGSPSPEALADRSFGTHRGARGAGVVVSGMKKIEGVLWAAGAEKSAGEWARRIGQESLAVGDWDTARRYLYASLDAPMSNYYRRKVCARLAWIEEDPEKAAHLLEVSCADTYGWMSDAAARKRTTGHDALADAYEGWLSNAVDLAVATESHALADHYRARLHADFPEHAIRDDGVSQDKQE